MPTPFVLVLTGYKQVGKDHLFKSLRDALNLKVLRLSFSDELRKLSHSIFDWLPENVPDALKDKPWPHPKNKNNLTPREIWKIVASDEHGVCFVQDDILTDKFIVNNWARLMDIDESEQVVYVITDLRKPTEYEFVKGCGFPIIRVNDPERVDPSQEDVVEQWISRFEVDHDLMYTKDDAGVREFLKLAESLLKFHRGE